MKKELILQLAQAEDIDVSLDLEYFENELSEWLDALRPVFGDVIDD